LGWAMATSSDSRLSFKKFEVTEFSSKLQQCCNQSLNKAFREFERNQENLVQFVRNSLVPGIEPAQSPRIVVHELSQNLDLSPTMQLDVEAVNIQGSELRFENVNFKLVNGESDQVEITAEIILGVKYEGVDHQVHQQEQIIPFFSTINLLNDFPDAAGVEGDLRLNNLVITYDLDPSINAIVSVTFIVFVEIVCRISLQVSGD